MIKKFSILIFLVFFASKGLGTDVQFVGVDEPIQSDVGYITLEWAPASEGEYTYEVERAQDREFASAETIYTGQDTKTFISGLPNGQFYFRVRTEAGAWSDLAEVQVEHFSLPFALLLFGLGLLTFCGIVGVIVWGNRQQNQLSPRVDSPLKS